MTSGARSPPPLWIQHPTPQRSERYHSPHRLRSHVHLTERFLIPRNPSSTPRVPPLCATETLAHITGPEKIPVFFWAPRVDVSPVYVRAPCLASGHLKEAIVEQRGANRGVEE